MNNIITQTQLEAYQAQTVSKDVHTVANFIAKNDNVNRKDIEVAFGWGTPRAQRALSDTEDLGIITKCGRKNKQSTYVFEPALNRRVFLSEQRRKLKCQRNAAALIKNSGEQMPHALKTWIKAWLKDWAEVTAA